MIDPDQYDGFATLEELNLSPEEIQELRKNKQELTQYGKEKIRELMNEEAQLTEKENKVLDIAKNIMEENKEAFQHLAAIERKEFAEKDFEDLTREQKIQLALEEIDWIVIGGQDGQEFYGSIQFLRKVLRSLR